MRTLYTQLNAHCAPYAAQWIGVSKKQSLEKINTAYKIGLRDFAENYAQELLLKAPQLPHDIRWHFIGHLQKNKVKSILPLIHTIHSVDSIALFKTIAQHAQNITKKVRILLQIHLSQEPSKFGIFPQELFTTLSSLLPLQNSYTSINGLMGMASFTQNEHLIRQEFRQLKTLFDTCKKDYFKNTPAFDTLSMGMSSDYKIALSEGSNMIRIGSLFFGTRL